MQCACAILSSVACPSLQYFPPYLKKKRHNFRRKVVEYKRCVLIFSTLLSEIFLILGRHDREIVINVQRASCKVPVILVRFNEC
jgi:hypothetical protein